MTTASSRSKFCQTGAATRPSPFGLDNEMFYGSHFARHTERACDGPHKYQADVTAVAAARAIFGKRTLYPVCYAQGSLARETGMNRNTPVGEGYVHVDQKPSTKAQRPSVRATAAVVHWVASHGDRPDQGPARVSDPRGSAHLSRAHVRWGRVQQHPPEGVGEPDPQRRGGDKRCPALARQGG